MGRSYRKTSFDESKSPTTAAILAVAPAIVSIGLLVLTNGGQLPSCVYGGLGMHYVGRWFKASLILLFFDIALIVAIKLAALMGLILLVSRLLFQLTVLPIWAVRVTREFNDLAQTLEARDVRAKQ